MISARFTYDGGHSSHRYNGFHMSIASLLGAGASVSQTMGNGWSALMVAAAQNHPEALEALLSAPADPEKPDAPGCDPDYRRPANGFSALMASSTSSPRATCASVLLQHGASVDLADDTGMTAMMFAAGHGHVDVVTCLLQAGANASRTRPGGTNALMDAAAGGHEDLVQVLVKAKAPVEARDDQGMTSLMHASASGNDAAMLPLLQAGAKVSRKDDAGRTALMHAANLEAAVRLLSNGAEPVNIPEVLMDDVLALHPELLPAGARRRSQARPASAPARSALPLSSDAVVSEASPASPGRTNGPTPQIGGKPLGSGAVAPGPQLAGARAGGRGRAGRAGGRGVRGGKSFSSLPLSEVQPKMASPLNLP